MIRTRTALALLFAVATLATRSEAQNKDKSKAPAPDDKCKIPTDHPDEVKSAAGSVAITQLGGKPDAQQKNLKNAIGQLTLRPEKYKDNQIGHDFVMGQALVLWSLQPNQPPVAKKGDIGYLSDKDQQVDLLAAADSSFTAVEKANPECAAQTSIYRQQPWGKLISPVGTLINNNQLDSASKLVDRSKVIYRSSPYTYYYDGQIAQKKNDLGAASDAYAKAADLAKQQLERDSAAGTPRDSNVASVREYSLFSAGYATQKSADKLTGEAKSAQLAKAAGYYKSYLAAYPNGPNAATAQNNLTMALKASGDTAALAGQWDDMLKNPGKYSSIQLYDAGTAAFTAGKIDQASKLMDAARAGNPWLRAGLYNAANVYWKAGQYDKMLPVSQRLVQIDPNNPDNYQLAAIAYQALAKDSSVKGTAKKAYADSAMGIYDQGEKVTVRVALNLVLEGTKRTVQGTVENKGTAPKSVTLKVDFIDGQGSVVATQSQPLQLAPKEKKDVSLQADGASIVGFKYAPIS
ncbi:MAG TPA: hypothetical protein VEI06_05525 [Gemmatimonadaceae bacterium]|nr:hypothetical protein [Gemmatimonadaceae bacterium]